jgi:UDP-N-acetylglucosamine--N-acetylmuramyl-(pentapeptide) pyrophosphoryl-undecaprenol N-acetylglucosamine transferase
MKIVLTGGGTGGHFYPIIAIAEEINQIAKDNRLLQPKLYFMSTDPYNEGLLFENSITFQKVFSGKIRRHKSVQNLLLNFLDLWRLAIGSILAIIKMFALYPDVVFGKGGYTSFPALFAARILNIPVVIHESDSTPGKVNAWAGKFAKRIAVSYPEAEKFFPEGKTAYTGNPIRKEVKEAMRDGAYEMLNLNPEIPTILVLGGSQGAKFINDVIINALPSLVSKYQILHQTGKKNFSIVEETKNVVLNGNKDIGNYRAYDYLDVLKLRAAAGVADLIISRAGSTIFEIAAWGKPSIIIPIPVETSHDQRSNAYSYARSGACEVIEEKNLTEHILVSEIESILANQAEKEAMIKSALSFSRKDSARLIAQEIVAIALEHEM